MKIKALSPFESFASLDKERRHELVKILFFQPTNAFNHCMAVLICLWFLWDSVSWVLLMLWAGTMIGMTVFWQTLVLFYRKLQPGPDKAGKWLRAFPIAGATMGFGWGIAAYFPGLILDVTATVFLSIMVIGVVGAGLGVLSPYFRSFIAFAFFALTPFSLAFFIEGGQLFNTLGGMFLLYLFAISLSGINMHRQVFKTIDLRIKNTDLINDLTEKNIQAEQAREAAEQANQSKSKFLASASHDLRQSLHALGLFVDALRNKNTNPDISELIDNIGLSTESLNDLLISLLDISRLYAGVLEANIRSFSLKSLLERIRVNTEQGIIEKGLVLNIQACNAIVRSDQNMLERILRNLVTNAKQYTREGEINVVCVKKGDQLWIEVRDTGIGIAQEDMQRIFVNFVQLDGSTTREFGGIGLGLAIVKQLVELHDGMIWVESSVNMGSTFCVALPLEAQHLL